MSDDNTGILKPRPGRSKQSLEQQIARKRMVGVAGMATGVALGKEKIEEDDPRWNWMTMGNHRRGGGTFK